jgi:hypothetical protein
MAIASAYPISMVALANATSANGTARNGNVLDLRKTEPGTVQVFCHSAITTSSVVATFKAQVCDDADPSTGTWYDVKLPNNAANVATAAGTGSNVDTYVALGIAMAHGSAHWFRIVATLSGAATAGADTTDCTYKFLKFGCLTRG